MPVLERDDLELHYEIEGDGPPLLMIAGMASDSASWAPLVPLLTPHFTLIRPDNRTTGRGIKDCPDQPLDHCRSAKAVCSRSSAS